MIYLIIFKITKERLNLPMHVRRPFLQSSRVLSCVWLWLLSTRVLVAIMAVQNSSILVAIYEVGCVGLGSSDQIDSVLTLSQPIALPSTHFNNNNTATEFQSSCGYGYTYN